MIPVEFSRGCVYQCSYCSAPSYAKMFQSAGKWLRFKTVDRLMAEIEFYASAYKVEYFYFIAETFLAMPQAMRQEFYRRYRAIGIPFWFNTRPETIRDEDMKALEEIGCHRISVGIESGNEPFRRNVLRRQYGNDQVLRAVEMIQKTNIEFSVNNMIGFPDENRELFFDTVELNRQFKAHSHTVSIFHPFRGTDLYDRCIQMGYWDPQKICTGNFIYPPLDMPSFSKEEVWGLYRTFNFYVRFPKSDWPRIQQAEKLTPEGECVRRELLAEAAQYE